MATVTLGSIKFNWKGAYNSSTAYAVDDVVSSGGNSYVCIQAHTNQAVGNATAYWNIMSSAGTNGTNGTNGTDVGTVITTQGDILYRDGSGLQRLPKGTANQVLKMNAGATAPEYGNLSSDYVKLASGTISNTNEVGIDGYYTSDYKNYKLVVNNLRNSNSSRQLYWRFRASNTTLTGNNYRYVENSNYNNSSNQSNPSSTKGWDNNHFANGWDLSTGSDRGMHFEMEIYDPQKTGTNKHMKFSYVEDVSDANYIVMGDGGGYYNGSSGAHSGVTIFPQSDNFASGDWYLYGIKG